MNRALRYRFVGAAVTAAILLSANGASARPRAKKPGPAHEQKTALTREQLRLCNGKNDASADLRIEACTAIKDVAPSARIIMLTISDEEADLYDAIKAGAMGYLLKEISIDEVAAAIRAVHGGQSLISPSMASKLLSEFASMIKKGDSRQQVPVPKLTDREMEVLRLVAKGLNNRDIAKQLFISENTVKNHVRNILEKLQLHSRMEAVVYAVREKLLEIT